MAPKKGKAPPPPPEPEVVEPPPKVYVVNGVVVSKAVAHLCGGENPDPETTALRERSGKLSSDIKMVELKRHLSTMRDFAHNHDPAGPSRTRSCWPGRFQGIERADIASKRLAKEVRNAAKASCAAAAASSSRPSGGLGSSVSLPSFSTTSRPYQNMRQPQENHRRTRVAQLPSLPGAAPAHIPGSSIDDAKRPLYDGFSRSMTRLMHDVDFANDELLKEDSHILRCGHLDRMHSWWGDHKLKQKPDPALGPAYVTFGKDEHVMAGSLRVEPQERRFAPRGSLTQSPAWFTEGVMMEGKPSMMESTASPGLLAENSSGAILVEEG